MHRFRTGNRAMQSAKFNLMSNELILTIFLVITHCPNWYHIIVNKFLFFFQVFLGAIDKLVVEYFQRLKLLLTTIIDLWPSINRDWLPLNKACLYSEQLFAHKWITCFKKESCSKNRPGSLSSACDLKRKSQQTWKTVHLKQLP